MTPEQFRTIRQRAGLTKSGLAALLRVTYRAVHQWETGERAVTGPVTVLMEQIQAGKLP